MRWQWSYACLALSNRCILPVVIFISNFDILDLRSRTTAAKQLLWLSNYAIKLTLTCVALSYILRCSLFHRNHFRTTWCTVSNQLHIDGFVQYCSSSIANALELLQSCTKPSGWTIKRGVRIISTPYCILTKIGALGYIYITVFRSNMLWQLVRILKS